MLINAAISAERNVINEKPTIFSKRMWDVKKKVIPVEIRATETTSKSFTKYLTNIPAKHIRGLNKTVILGTANIRGLEL